VTSGLPTVDYFLSNALMEPPNGQDHYSEQLIKLPGIGICCQKPVIPRALLEKSRRDFGLREDAVLYLSCQSIFKYLPQHDDVFPAIAKRVPGAQFVFLIPNDYVQANFRRRLELAFAAGELLAKNYCVCLPRQDILDYWNLNLLADVYLDTIEWSGFITTLEAIACRLPIVTLPGQFMRGRQSCAILTEFGVTETIAGDKSDYIDIAIRLGVEHAWRAGW
jgi:predicted O-linked N-acetylglucosamine transferase (SPINDLY family)